MCYPIFEDTAVRKEQKARSRQRILDAAAECFRTQGYNATGINELMRRSNLTNGAFYAHFSSKEELLSQAAVAAAKQMKENWVEGLEGLPPYQRVTTLLARYLSEDHRDSPQQGCTLPTLGAEIARQGDQVRIAVEQQLHLSISPLTEALHELKVKRVDELAWCLLSLCIGAITLARAVNDGSLSTKILEGALCQAMQLIDSQVKAGV